MCYSCQHGYQSEHRTWISDKTQIVLCWATVHTHQGPPCDCLFVYWPVANKQTWHAFPNPWKLTGRTDIMFFRFHVGPGLHSERSYARSLAYVEEFWRLPPQSGNLLCYEFGCVRLYSTIPKPGLLHHRHMAYLRPSTHNAESSAPDHPSLDSARVTCAAQARASRGERGLQL